jgi:hypothetical protein
MSSDQTFLIVGASLATSPRPDANLTEKSPATRGRRRNTKETPWPP